VPTDVRAIRELDFLATPLDFGKYWDGKRIFGDGKTWRGLITGTIAGTIIGFLQYNYRGVATGFLMGAFNFSGLVLFEMTVELAFLMSVGALFGDAFASLIKRRMSIKRGTLVPIMDQLDFLVGAFFFAWLVVPINPLMFFIAVLITIPMHVVGNVLAWTAKIKKEPW
jgi:CDP-2,3-bis-(O-geranylgeranyl)-sn-glycerol synthase